MTVNQISSAGKQVKQAINGLMKLLSILCLLYVFICSLDVLQDAFKLVGGRTAGEVLSNNELLNNPMCGLMLGVLITVMVQSSSTSTSIAVTMVGSGLLQVKQAIPIVMGSNIGTTVTNTFVSLSQSADRQMFERAFAGATVHDMFNWLTVTILMITEISTGYLEKLTNLMVDGFTTPTNIDNPQFLKVITKPLTHLIVQVDNKVIEAIAQRSDRQKFPLMKRFCNEVVFTYSDVFPTDFPSNATEIYENLKSQPYTFNVNFDENNTFLTWSQLDTTASTLCQHLFVNSGLEDAAVGGILLAISLISMILCLVLLVKILNGLMSGPLAVVVKKFINSDLPKPFSCLTGYLAIIVGALGTILVQSSSVFTSALTPLVGLGVVSIERVYPLTLGSNIGTTITGILASFTSDPKTIRYSFQIAMVHLFFNITGIILFYPIPFMRRIPITLAKKLAKTTAGHRWFAGFYLIMIFFVLPLSIFGLSLAGWHILAGVLGPVVILLIFVIVVNIIQNSKPDLLPQFIKTWDFLPEPLRSLDPYEQFFIKVCCCKRNLNASLLKDEKITKEESQDHHLLEVFINKTGDNDDIQTKTDDVKTSFKFVTEIQDHSEKRPIDDFSVSKCTKL